MPNRELIEKVVRIAVNAPSGHNCQPWIFTAEDGALYLYNDPSRDSTLFNDKQKGSLISHGAVIENLAIAASHFGYEAKISLFPEGESSNLVAIIGFSETKHPYAYDYLFSEILARTTNRKAYRQEKLKSEDTTEVYALINDPLSYPSVILLENRDDITQASRLFSVGDRILFDNYHLHRSLFSIVNWDAKQEEERKRGLYLGTKELPKPVQVFFKHFVRHWTLMRAFSFFDFPKKMAEKRRILYSYCSAIGLVIAENDSPASFVKAGRSLQRFWLKVSALGLSFQPISVGLLYLGQRTIIENPIELSSRQYRYIKEAYSGIVKLFKIRTSVPAFSFRIGYSTPPTARSMKRSADLTFM